MGELKNATTLPEDLMYAEILPRIPAKYILRCRLVCKSWNSVFSTPAFVNSHLARQLHNNSEENDRIIVQPCGFDGGVDVLSHSDSILVRKVPCACDNLCGSINGLVLMVSKPEKRYCLWNPATGQVKLFDFPPTHIEGDGGYVGGFCWDHVQNDYKALMFCYDSILSPPRQIYIYSTNSTTWTCLCNPQNLMLPGLHDSFWMLLGHSTIVKGTPYWSCSKFLTLPGEKHVREFFWTFKFVPEINEFRTLPDLDSLKCCGDTFSIVNIKDRLVGMTYNSVTHGGTNMVDMYSLDNEESSSGVWSKMYKIGPVNFGYNQRLLHAFRNGGEILIGGDSGTFACYDPKTEEIKSIAGTTSTRFSFRKFVGYRYNYTPSLVRVRGMKSIQNFSTKGELKEFAL
ncbi:putative F-box protein At3g17490 [Daucus carota subsp. sativus]|uniref:putative F-box protein At3g17490 n=1 Tax=Daucus carota subsp. sativus TaxID=79200 RepID=UPI0007EF06A6|nr:PREDICTED: putative F-box protein At3g17490 [Daucus carota subsp. sativus]